MIALLLAHVNKPWPLLVRKRSLQMHVRMACYWLAIFLLWPCIVCQPCQYLGTLYKLKVHTSLFLAHIIVLVLFTRCMFYTLTGSGTKSLSNFSRPHGHTWSYTHPFPSRASSRAASPLLPFNMPAPRAASPDQEPQAVSPPPSTAKGVGSAVDQ